MTFQIRLADKIIEIRSKYKLIKDFCSSYIIDPQDKPDLIIETKMEDLYNSVIKLRQKNAELYHADEECPDLETIEKLTIYEKIANALLDYDTLLVHGSVVSTNSEGYMITAESGVGKTTRTKLWLDHIPNTVVINGDKPLIRFSEDEIEIYGTPWSGKEGWNNNISVPLKAIYFLERTEEGEQDVVKPIEEADAMIRLFNQTHQPPDKMAMLRIFTLFKRMTGKVKFYLFRSSPTMEAVKLAYDTANEE